jgi:arabinofuranosyltransferase
LSSPTPAADLPAAELPPADTGADASVPTAATANTTTTAAATTAASLGIPSSRQPSEQMSGSASGQPGDEHTGSVPEHTGDEQSTPETAEPTGSTAHLEDPATSGTLATPETQATPESAEPPPAADLPRRGSRISTALRQLPILIPPLVWLYLGWQRRWITDDGLIAARTVRQILAGNGPVFNAGERVEANTSTLWTWLLAGVTWVSHASVYAVMVDTGLVLAPLGLLLALLGARNLHRRTSPGRLYLPAGAVVVLALPPFWDFVTSGLEDSLIFCWLGLVWFLVTGLRRESRARATWAVFLAGLSWLVRPDLALAGILFLAAIWLIVRPGRWRTVRLLVVGGIVPLAYEIFRMGYYGLLVPNTALAKEASNTHFAVGWAYLLNFVGPYDLWLPLALLALLLPLTIGWRRLDRAAWTVCGAAVIAAVLMSGYVVAIGGDFMHARMLLPPMFTLLLPVMVIPVSVPRRTAPATGPDCAASTDQSPAQAPAPANPLRTLIPVGLCLAALLAWAFTCGINWRLPQQPGVIPASGITDERAFWAARTEQRNPDVPQEYERTIFGVATNSGSLAWAVAQSAGSDRPPVLLFIPPGGTKLVAVPLTKLTYSVAVPSDILGTLGAVVPLNGLAIDVHGLSYALGSHLVEGPDGRVGHEKYADPAWIVAEYTDATSVPGISSAEIAAARTALSCGGLAELQQATEAPMSWDRFWSNLADAPGLDSLRIANDPEQAEAQLCH